MLNSLLPKHYHLQKPKYSPSLSKTPNRQKQFAKPKAHLRYNKSFELKKGIIMINPKEFLAEFYRKTFIDRSVQSEIARSYQTISHFHSRKFKRQGVSCKRYNTNNYNKRERELITDDLNSNDNQKTSHRETTHTINTNSNVKSKQIATLTPSLYGNYQLKKEMLLSEIEQYKRVRGDLINKKASPVMNNKTVEMLLSDIKKYKKMTEDCKHAFIELSYQINSLKKQLSKIKKDE